MSRLASSKGATTVELGLILPLLVLILFGIVDFGRLFFVQISVVSASQEVARVGSFRLEGYVCPGSLLPTSCANPVVSLDFVQGDPATGEGNLNDVAKKAAPSASQFAQLSQEGQLQVNYSSIEACSLYLNNKEDFKATVEVPFKWLLPIDGFINSSSGSFKVRATGVMRCQK